MAKRTWKDRVVERPRTFSIQNNADGTITLIPAPGQIVEPGTPVNATNLNGLEGDLESHLADITAHGEVLSLYRLNKDANGIYTELQYKRPDGTLAKKSMLSGGTSPKYTTRTVTYYKVDGVTVVLTKTYALTYTEDDLTSEVLQ